MFERHRDRRHTNIVFVIFRLILSVVMFAVLLGGVYSAYKHFSGFDPLKLDPKSLISFVSRVKSIDDVMKIAPGFSNPTAQKILGQVSSGSNTKVLFKFLLVADSHSDNSNLSKAIEQAKAFHPDLSFIIGLGDYSDVGTIDELKVAKSVFDRAGLRYFLLPGDHDYWESRDKKEAPDSNFKQVFGPTFQAFTYENFKFLLLNNSDNYLGINEEQNKWIESELEKVKTETGRGVLVFLHEPLFHPSSDRVMGKVEGKLKQQAQSLIFQLKTKGVKKVFAGDTHYFSEYLEPATDLPMVTVGAITGDRNPQAPRYGVGYVFEDGSIKVEDVGIR